VDPEALIRKDKTFVWHPFTPNDLWNDPEFIPIIIAEAEGSELRDIHGKAYLDGNASIWTNCHGHRHPHVHAAIKKQLDQVAHSSFLGLTNTIAPILAELLCRTASLDRCFFSDDGSTATETALKAVIQFFQQNGQPERSRVVSLGSGYHGDTVGAMSMGHSSQFHRTFGPLLFTSTEVLSPGCYRCPYNRAQPEKSDARVSRKCKWECVGELEKGLNGSDDDPDPAALVLEPRVQGPAGFVMHPDGYLKKARQLASDFGAHLVLDEVMVGMGRTGPLFAFQKESIQPDLIALAKGLTNGTLPLAATLCRENLYDGFGGKPERTFFHGHSYTGNQLGCAAALASLRLTLSGDSLAARQSIETVLTRVGQTFWAHPQVGDVRQEGCILAIELVQEFSTRQRFAPSLRLGARICEEASKRGLLTRPVGDVLVLMPPYCSTRTQVEDMGRILLESLNAVCPG